MYPGPFAPIQEDDISDLGLIDACAAPGCPVCRCVAQAGRGHLESLLYECVTDVDSRRRLRASWGLCNWHGWMLLEIGGARSGVAILCEDLVRRLVGRAETAARRGLASRLRTWFARGRPAAGERLAALYRRRARCPVCEAGAAAEAQHLRAMLARADQPDFRSAYARSDGLCAPHVMRAVELARRHPGLPPLLDLTRRRWAAIGEDLASFIAKHDYRDARPFSEAEADACRRALGLLGGGPGLFGNHLRDWRPR